MYSDVAGFISPTKLGFYNLFSPTANKVATNNNVENNSNQQVAAANAANNNIPIRITENPISEAVPC